MKNNIGSKEENKSPKPKVTSSEGSPAISISDSILSTTTPSLGWKPIEISLAPNELLHDRAGPNQTTKNVGDFIDMMHTSDVYDIMFAHSTVLQRDPRNRPTPTFKAHPEASRFSDVPCFEETRAKAKHPTADHDFYHANLVSGYRNRKFIIAQTPRISDSAEQWWNLIWQNKVGIIVAMVPLDEKQFSLYLPTRSDQKITIGPYTIENSGTHNSRDHYDATSLYVSNGGQLRHILHVLHYGWRVEKGTPTRPTEILHLLADINIASESLIDEAEGIGWLTPQEPMPWLIHCPTGAGASAALAALDTICYRLDDTIEMPEGPLIDIENTVLKMRTERAMAVQKPELYLFLHLSALEYAIRKNMLRRDDASALNLGGFKMFPVKDIEKPKP